MKNEILLFENQDVKLEVNMKDDRVCLMQGQMAELFNISRTNIIEHISNIYSDEELDKNSACQDFRQVRKEGKRTVSRNITHYNLDMILSVGYRIKSKTATKFRKWATDVLKRYITQGYALNNKVLSAHQAKIINLQLTINLLSRSIQNQVETVEEGKNVAKILDNFAKGLDLLDNFDHKALDTKGQTQKIAVEISEKEYLNVIDKMKSEFASDVFANPKDGSFASSVNQKRLKYLEKAVKLIDIA